MVRDQMQQFMIMFANQTSARLSPDFPPRERLDPILPSIGTSHGGVEFVELGTDPIATRDNVTSRRVEAQMNYDHTNFPMLKLELPVFNESKP